MRFSTIVLGVLSAQFAGCARGQLASATTDDLSGLTLPLLTDGGVRLAVAGKVGPRDATVLFDSTRELSSASQGCFDGSLPLVSMVKMESLRGNTVELPGAKLSGLSLGGVSYRDIEVAVEPDTGCAVRLGLELLKPYALHFRPLPPQVNIRRSMHDGEVEALRKHSGVSVLAMDKAHGHEWPLLVTRASQGPVNTVATFVVASADSRSELSAQALEGQGIKSLGQMAQLLGVPSGSLAEEERSAVFIEVLELSPQVSSGPLWVKASANWSSTAQGTLGADVWGAFETTFDFGKGVLVLHARRVPRPVISKEAPEQKLVERFVGWRKAGQPRDTLSEPVEP